MRTLLSATLAVLLVAAVTAQSSKQTEHETSIHNIISNVNLVINSLGGFEGAVDKLTYISKLVKKAYENDGIGGWMARSLIKMELNELKQKALEAEKQMINKLLDELDAKIGMKSATYAAISAENYVFSEAVTRAISTIRQSIAEIVREIDQAQKEHDDAAVIISGDVKDRLTERIAGLKDKLHDLSKKLMDKLTGRDKTADVYSANAAVQNEQVQAEFEQEEQEEEDEETNAQSHAVQKRSAGTYFIDVLVKQLIETLRPKILEFIEQIGVAKREVAKAVGENKKLALEHLAELKRKLKQARRDLRDALRGRKTAEELEKDLKETL